MKIELVIRHGIGAVGENRRLDSGFSGCLERIPDHPGIHGSALERRPRVSRRQEHRSDVGIFDVGFLQRLDEEIVNVGALVEGATFLPFSSATDLIGLPFGTRIASPLGRWRLVGDIADRCAGGLREDRRRLACVTEIERTNIDGFQQRGACRKLPST